MATFLHITDLHIVAEAPQATAKLDRLIALAQSADPAPDFIIASGDLTDHGDKASYSILAERMAELRIPVFYALGNHDKRSGFRAAFSGYEGDLDAPLDHDAVCAGYHIVVLDSSLPGKTSGGFEDGQLDALHAALARHTDLPKIMVLHHPPATQDETQRNWAVLNATDSARLGQALAGHDVLALLCGHIHTNRVMIWNGLPVISNVGLDSVIDPTHDLKPDGGLHITEGSGFGIGRITSREIGMAFADLAPGPTIKILPEGALRHLK
ncbi:MAG: metallophosphoesterase [Pseudomonadota bacterium]